MNPAWGSNLRRWMFYAPFWIPGLWPAILILFINKLSSHWHFLPKHQETHFVLCRGGRIRDICLWAFNQDLASILFKTVVHFKRVRQQIFRFQPTNQLSFWRVNATKGVVCFLLNPPNTMLYQIIISKVGKPVSIEIKNEQHFNSLTNGQFAIRKLILQPCTLFNLIEKGWNTFYPFRPSENKRFF